jgi:mannose/fructose/N-acetylgalactosamine-specific phosphotransferase system component IID
MIAIGVFLVFGACMAAFAGTTLVWPGSALDKIWALNKAAHTQLSSAGSSVGGLFFLLSLTLIAAAVGWFKHRVWGWRLAVGIISAQVVGDLVNLLRGDLLRGGSGLTIASALLFYLLRSNVRTRFH